MVRNAWSQCSLGERTISDVEYKPALPTDDPPWRPGELWDQLSHTAVTGTFCEV